MIRSEDGTPRRMLGAHTDVTELKEAESSLRTRTEHLEQSNRELAHFASVASHDLQEPLRMVKSFTELLRTRIDPDDEDAQKYMAYVVDGADRMKALVDDLLSYARTGQNTELTSVDLNEVVETVLADFADVVSAASAPGRGSTFSFTIPDEAPASRTAPRAERRPAVSGA